MGMKCEENLRELEDKGRREKLNEKQLNEKFGIVVIIGARSRDSSPFFHSIVLYKTMHSFIT